MFLLVVLTACAAPPPVEAPASDEAHAEGLVFEPLAPRYASVSDIQPVLVNRGSRSVYLGTAHPLAAAFLERWDPWGEAWQDGTKPVVCGTVKDPETPIEIEPGAKVVTIAWEGPVEERYGELVFAVGTFASQPLRGRYRLRFRYALTPWTLSLRPETIYTVYSTPFEIGGKE